ncbi:hypothetical protein AC629_13130 [Bradyrhizobium sp. NAS80.1]|nr:hypothetical protein AC629_13130 [Bradyrhizobium sp. NAS80.1]
MHWPDYQDYCFQFLRTLGVAQEGASTISECFLTASRITAGDDESWYREWSKIADASRGRADLAWEAGHFQSAMSNWLRASNYYRTAECFLKPEDSRRVSVFEKMERCSHSYLKCMSPAGEIVKIPYEDNNSLCGYFLRAVSAAENTPVVICVGGLSEPKEELLYKMPRHALSRGLSLLLVDLPGQGASAFRNKIRGRHDQEVPLSYCLDYLLGRGDVDVKRIALFGDNFGGSYASRAAGADGRFAAVVCDGGLWDQNERSFLTKWLSVGGDAEFGHNMKSPPHWMAGKIKCPYLVTVGEHDFVDVSNAIELYEYHREAGAKIDLKIFSADETGASFCQMDNPTLGKEFIFDWIKARLTSQ